MVGVMLEESEVRMGFVGAVKPGRQRHGDGQSLRSASRTCGRVGFGRTACGVQLEDGRQSRVVEEALEKKGVQREKLDVGEGEIVVVTGFETFNAGLYRIAVELLSKSMKGVKVRFFTDVSVEQEDKALEQALERADAVLFSLIFDYDQVKWLTDRVGRVPTRFVFESALELMQLNQVGEFKMDGGNSSEGGKPPQMPGPIKTLLKKFGVIGREEDKMAGYLQMLKTGPKLLRFIPGEGKIKNLRDWLTVYAYWNAGSVDNVVAMVGYIATEVLGLKLQDQRQRIPDPVPIPAKGLVHPFHQTPFENPQDYLKWYEKWFPRRKDWPRVGILLYRKHVISGLEYINKLIQHMEAEGLVPVPYFINGVEGHMIVRDNFTTEQEKQRPGDFRVRAKEAVEVDAIVSTIGFPLVGGPAGSMEGGRKIDVARRILKAKDVPYIVAAPLLTQSIQSWEQSGLNGLQSIVLYALPEMDGAVDTVPLGGLEGDEIRLVKDRLQRLSGRVKQWIELRKKPLKDVKVAIVLYGYPPGIGAAGTAALLNVPKSLEKILSSMAAEGYDVGDLLERDFEELIKEVKRSDELYPTSKEDRGNGSTTGIQKTMRDRLEEMNTVSQSQLSEWIGVPQMNRIERSWGPRGANPVIKASGEELLIGGVSSGNIWIGVQPPLGIPGDPMRLLFEKGLTPHPQYAGFYRWIEESYEADVCIHLGMHGTVEWLPGSPLGNTAESWPDVLLGNLPNLYIYAANNPSESALAKRRGYGVLVSHNVPPYARAGLYNELSTLKNLVFDYRASETEEEKSQLYSDIVEVMEKAGLTQEVNKAFGSQSTEGSENVSPSTGDERNAYVVAVGNYLGLLENRLFSSGLHVLGRNPTENELAEYLRPQLKQLSGDEELLETIAFARESVEVVESKYTEEADRECVRAAFETREFLLRNGEELSGLLRGLRGGYVEPALGGDVIRDGKAVLPTGRNIYSLDPYRIPSRTAFAAGKRLAEQYIAQYRKSHDGAYPETIAVPLWGLDNIKTRGESVGIVLGLVGANLTCDATGRTVSFDLIPLAELGRPRVDVLCSLSGIFRDSFEHVVNLLDDMFRRAADADEPGDMNFVKKHCFEMQDDDDDEALEEETKSRLFSNPAGDFGSLVNEIVTSGTWEDGEELGDTWKSRNAFAYGRNQNGEKQERTLNNLLARTNGLLQEIDSVEYGLTDIQEYYANSGALLTAARAEKKKQRPESEAEPPAEASFVEAFSSGSPDRDFNIKPLKDMLNVEYRTKLLNPKWANAMLENGSGGAYEVSQRFTALLGWSGTSDFRGEYVFNQSAELYVTNREVAAKLREANPEAYRNLVSRLLEAASREFWESPNEDVIKQLREDYEDIDSEIEGVA